MLIGPRDERFFRSTRGRIVVLLRPGARTVDELAQALQVTDSAVRMHLATLERDGLVRRDGERRGTGKPAYAYELTPEAEQLFPKAYERALGALLGALSERLPPATVDAVLREAGRGLAAERAGPAVGPAPAGDDPRARLERAVAIFGELGGLPRLEERDGALALISHSCPLAAVVPAHPEVCRLAEALLAEIMGAPVREACPRGSPPRCTFRLPASTA
jgi:predicted ArsR family transcriptional regulator